jgi:hypothetical protein
MKRPRVLTIILWTLTIFCIFLALKSSNEPVLEIFKTTPIETSFRQFSTGNSIIFNLSIGFLVSIIFYLLIVWIPDRRRRKIIKHNIGEQYRNFKENTIDLLLDACSEGKNSELISRLCDLKYFRDYFNKFISEDQRRWHAVFNGLDELYLN